jgi:hypothetical protein
MKEGERKRRDWGLLLLFLFLGILLMLLAGQKGTQLLPRWNLRADIGSNLNPNDFQLGPDSRGFQPLRPEILTPPVWNNDFLTPHPEDDANATLPTFVVFDPSSTPSATPSPTNSPTGTATTVITTSTQPTTTATTTRTRRPPKDDTPTSTSATTPASVCTDPAANNYGGPLPCTYDPVSSLLVGAPTSVPADTNIGAPDGAIGGVPDGYYIILSLSATPIVVNGPSDTNYDFVYYERPAGVGIEMDSVIISISTDNATYYVVFNWGDGTPDNNSNVGDVAGAENDNQPIDSSQLYGTPPQDTGILVDVDNAPSHPPVGTYEYLAIQAPLAPVGDGNDGADVDSIQVTEVAP